MMAIRRSSIARAARSWLSRSVYFLLTSSASSDCDLRSPMPRSWRTSVSSRSGGTRTVTSPHLAVRELLRAGRSDIPAGLRRELRDLCKGGVEAVDFEFEGTVADDLPRRRLGLAGGLV